MAVMDTEKGVQTPTFAWSKIPKELSVLDSKCCRRISVESMPIRFAYVGRMHLYRGCTVGVCSCLKEFVFDDVLYKATMKH